MLNTFHFWFFNYLKVKSFQFHAEHFSLFVFHLQLKSAW